jgi:hypothetical protein
MFDEQYRSFSSSLCIFLPLPRHSVAVRKVSVVEIIGFMFAVCMAKVNLQSKAEFAPGRKILSDLMSTKKTGVFM